MGNEWKSKPLECAKIDKDIEYIMTIDENGSSSNFDSIFQKVKNNELIDYNDRFFTLTGVILNRKEMIDFYKNINGIKLKYWKNGCWYNKKNNRLEKVHFHSHEFRNYSNRKKAFRLINDVKVFNNFVFDLTQVISNTNFMVISTNFCLYSLAKKYIKPENPYKLGMHILIERFAMFLNSKKKKVL